MLCVFFSLFLSRLVLVCVGFLSFVYFAFIRLGFYVTCALLVSLFYVLFVFFLSFSSFFFSSSLFVAVAVIVSRV